MRITDIREQAIPVSRYADPAIPSGGLTTSVVAVVTDVVREGRAVTGYGYASVGRHAQGGLIRERFAPRLLAAADTIADDAGTNVDPFRAWRAMMAGEKPGGHGERCVAIGVLDMAIWDAAAKIAGLPLHRFIAGRLARDAATRVRVYAGGGYRYPHDDLARLSDEMRRIVELGYTHAKIKIGGPDIDEDKRRIEVAAARLADSSHLAVDAMNTYDATSGRAAAAMLAPFGLRWFEDLCDPHDLPLHADLTAQYPPPVAAGEALFSLAEAKLLERYGGLRADRDVLVFDPVHCYGLPGYLQIVDHFVASGWRRDAFWPHGGHLFSLHVVAALGLGGAEVSPFAFHPFSGLADGESVDAGCAAVPQAPGIGFELHADAYRTFRALVER
ncbi:mandelate racemase [Burkholderia sp. AU19243]|uniref:enolase C-terminal domain-like protein n=1 Tax=Burkholderia TaxID=32008 RepID=UPI0008413BA5|nr:MULTISPECIES: enolase C-terminal domain-like protein [Burkholderia]MBR8140875.1 mandelate racemase [Burkholderia vietnamiensis]AOK03763.1 mandelate racemase [Burkholderia latens]MBR8361832.1 mandelate racemase [Burkholderia sp. AU19243]MCA8307066.1 mandelate racemase [Burkholderia sp. AU28942]QTO49150.1 mandelate racemase [Burkholderia latens]